MSENKEKEHSLFALWARDDESDVPVFLIRCPCGETVYKLEKDFFKDPPDLYPGMTMEEYKRTQREHQKLQGMKKQIQRVALAQHADNYPDCPAVDEMKKEAGVSSVQEIPNPFRN